MFVLPSINVVFLLGLWLTTLLPFYGDIFVCSEKWGDLCFCPRRVHEKPHALVSNGSLPGERQLMNMETWLPSSIQDLQCISLKADWARGKRRVQYGLLGKCRVCFISWFYFPCLTPPAFRTIECWGVSVYLEFFCKTSHKMKIKVVSHW